MHTNTGLLVKIGVSKQSALHIMRAFVSGLVGSPEKNGCTYVAQFKMKTRAYCSAAFLTVHTPPHTGYTSFIVVKKHCGHVKRS